VASPSGDPRAEAPRRGGVFDLAMAMGEGWGTALIHTFGGDIRCLLGGVRNGQWRSKQARARYRNQYRYRGDAGWDSGTRNRVAQPYSCGSEMARRQTEQGSIPIPIPISIPISISISTLIGRIGNYCLEAEARRIGLFRRIFSHRGHRVHREDLLYAIGETPRNSAEVKSNWK
jgi:hypothetical protein